MAAGHITLSIPTFEVGDLRLRAPRMEDLAAFVAFRASERSRGVGGPFPDPAGAFQSLSAIVGHWHLRGYGRWLVADRDTDAALGLVGPFFPTDWPEPEIAWSLFEGAEGRGIAYRAARFARDYVYTVLGWSTVISCAMADNTRSIALARRLGAVREDDFDHPTYGTMSVWRHPAPEVVE
jgi:ribosomal-protein-alanine N-acetyltransferase